MCSEFWSMYNKGEINKYNCKMSLSLTYLSFLSSVNVHLDQSFISAKYEML